MIGFVVLVHRLQPPGVLRRGILDWRICAGEFGIWLARRSRFLISLLFLKLDSVFFLLLFCFVVIDLISVLFMCFLLLVFGF